MGVPKQRHTKSRRNKRRMHIFLKQPILARCPKCGKPVLPHTICPNCGCYKGREVIDVLAKLKKKERKKREKEIETKGREEKKELKKQRSLSWKELSRK